MSETNIKKNSDIQDWKKKEVNEKPKYIKFLLTMNPNWSYKEDDYKLNDDIEIFEVTATDK